MPMEEEAQFVAVVGLFLHPDMTNDTGSRLSSAAIWIPINRAFLKPAITI